MLFRSPAPTSSPKPSNNYKAVRHNQKKRGRLLRVLNPESVLFLIFVNAVNQTRMLRCESTGRWFVLMFTFAFVFNFGFGLNPFPIFNCKITLLNRLSVQRYPNSRIQKTQGFVYRPSCLFRTSLSKKIQTIQ